MTPPGASLRRLVVALLRDPEEALDLLQQPSSRAHAPLGRFDRCVLGWRLSRSTAAGTGTAVEELSQAEAAEALDTSVKAVHTRLRRARSVLSAGRRP